MPLRILIVDDYELVREGLRSVLAHDPGVQVVGEATNGREAVELARSLRPDLILMDLRMPEMDGLTATRLIKAEMPAVCVLMLTIVDTADYLAEALAAGASGYLLKDASGAELMGAIQRVAAGESVVDPSLMVEALRRLATMSAAPTRQAVRQPPSERLTRREIDVLRLVADGLTNSEIASRLSISPNTVKSHVEHIISKMGVADRTEAAVQAIVRGILS